LVQCHLGFGDRGDPDLDGFACRDLGTNGVQLPLYILLRQSVDLLLHIKIRDEVIYHLDGIDIAERKSGILGGELCAGVGLSAAHAVGVDEEEYSARIWALLRKSRTIMGISQLYTGQTIPTASSAISMLSCRMSCGMESSVPPIRRATYRQLPLSVK